MKSVIPLLVGTLLAFAAVPRCHAADAAPPATLATASSRIEQAFQRGDSAVLLEIASHLKKTAGPAAQYSDYYLGYANYALARLCIGRNDANADRHVGAAEAALQRALDADSAFAEAHALLASVYGLEIGLHPFHGLWLGRRIGEQLDRAEKLAPNNPRVILARAISDYHAPASFGGDKQRAMRGFGKAIAAFRDFSPASPPAPTWGEAEAYVLRARAEAKTGDVMAARRDYRAALALTPDYVDARVGLAHTSAPVGASPKH